MIFTLISITVPCQRVEIHGFHQRKRAGFRQPNFFSFPKAAKKHTGEAYISTEAHLTTTWKGVVLLYGKTAPVRQGVWLEVLRVLFRGLWKELVESVCWHQAQ